MTPQLAALLSFGAVGLAALVALLLDMSRLRVLSRLLPAALLAVAGVSALVAAWTLPSSEGLAGFYVGSVRSAIFGVAASCAALTVLVADRDRRPGQFTALVSLAVLGAGLAASAGDLVSLLVGIETAALCSYALVARPGTPQAAEAAMKYFVQGAVATGFYVLGLALIVGLFVPDGGLLALANAGVLDTGLESALTLAIVALLLALAFKIGAAPLHSWAPDAYETASAPGAAYLAGSLKVALFGSLAAVVTPVAAAQVGADGSLGALVYQLFGVIGALALLSLLVGTTVALRTDSLRRMLGYAGVAQVGYALVALAALNTSGALFFMATYALGTTAAFLGAEAFERLEPGWDGTISGLAGFGRRHTLTSAALTLSLLSLAGLPPLLGFWGKFQVFGTVVRSAASFLDSGLIGFGWWLALLAAVGVLGAVVSLAYYGGVVRSLYIDPAPRETALGDPSTDSPRAARVVVAALVVLACVLVIAGVLPLLVGLEPLVRGFLPQ